MYLSLIDSLLAKKAAEDAEFQRQIEEYAAQGIAATIVEDESAKWAVFAISSNRKNQSFFNYYGPRKLVTGEPAPDQPEQPTGGTGKIVLKKTAGGTTTGLAGARFSIYFNGQIVGSDVTDGNGEIHIENAATGLWTFVETAAPSGYCVDPTPKSVYYTTDAAGQIVIEGLTDGMTVTAKEVKSVDGFVLDGTPQSIKIDQSQSPQRMTFWNERQGALIINKLSSLDRKTPLEGVTFKITTATGEFVPDENGKISSNGLYYTDENGQIILKGVTGTLVVTEEKSISGYTIDENTRTQTVVVNPNDTQSLYFYNAPIGGLELLKVNAADKTQRIPNTTFEIRRVSDGGLVDTVTTGTDGRVYVPLESGSYYAVETEAGKGFQLDNTPIYFAVEDGKTTTKTVTNKAISGILIHKVDSATGEGIYGVSFILYDSGNNPIAQETSDDRGYVRFENLTAGRYYLHELENEGYIPDTQKKTVYFDYRQRGQFEWTGPAILFACLIFSLIAPKYIWNIIGI